MQPLEARQHFSFSEDFAAGAGNFTPSAGTWGVVSQTYQVTTAANTVTNHLNNRSTHNTAVSGNYVVSATAQTVGTSSAWNDVALVFGYQDADNYYFYSSNESNDGLTSGIFKVVGGTTTELADITSPIVSDTNYALKIERTGSTINAYRDGTLLATASDSTFAGGKVGFGSKGDRIIVDDLNVTTVPAAPSALTATAASASQINLAWADNSADEAGFTVDRATDSGFTQNVVSTNVLANSTAFNATGLAGSTTYYFRVRATNAAGASANTATASATTNSAAVSTVYVGADADNNGTGTSANPYGSLNAAFASSAVVSGSQILVQNGTYGAQDVLDKAAAASFTQNVTIKPVAGATPSFTGAVEIEAKHVTLSGFTFTGFVASRGGGDYFIAENNVIKNGLSINSSYATVRNNQFIDGVDQDALKIQGASSVGAPSHDILIENNYIANYRAVTAGTHVDAIQMLNTHDVILRRNRISFDGNAGGMLFTPSVGPVYDITVENNFMIDGPNKAQAGGQLFNSSDERVTGLKVINNTMLGTVATQGTTNLFRNNIILKLATLSGRAASSHDHNYVTQASGLTLDSTDVLGVLPKFVNRDAVDLHLVLVNGSAVDVNNNPINLKFGTSTLAPAIDLDGQSRDPLNEWVGADRP